MCRCRELAHVKCLEQGLHTWGADHRLSTPGIEKSGTGHSLTTARSQTVEACRLERFSLNSHLWLKIITVCVCLYVGGVHI